MSRPVELLRRHGLALGLAAAAAWVLVDATLPALTARRQARARQAEAERQVDQRRAAVERSELWLQGASLDPYLRERLVEGVERSPDLPGPRLLPPEDRATDDPAGGSGAAGGSSSGGGDDAGDR